LGPVDCVRDSSEMAILINEKTKVLVQGITGREGSDRTRYMLDYGTKVMGGVTPGRGGSKVWGLPVFNSVKDALKCVGNIDASVTFVPGPQVKKAVIEAIESNIPLVLVPAERVPLHDTLHMISLASSKGVRILGPGSLGLISPGKAVIGGLGGSEGFAREIFSPGDIGVMSRSGGQTSTVAWSLAEVGIGTSTALHIGSEPIVGLTFAQVLPLFEDDAETRAVVMFGEIGGIAEEEAAEVVRDRKYTKPLIVYIAGRNLPAGVRFSHASAIIEKGRGTAESKIKALEDVGAYVVQSPQDIVPAVTKALKAVS